MPRRPYSSVYFSPQRGAAGVLIGFIDRTQKTLDCAVYSITHKEIAEALIRAHDRGVAVRVLCDNTLAGHSASQDEVLRRAGVPVRCDRSSAAMHHKFMVCDNGRVGLWAVLTGSFNWTDNADTRNAENFVVIRLKDTVSSFDDEFARLWAVASPLILGESDNG